MIFVVFFFQRKLWKSVEKKSLDFVPGSLPFGKRAASLCNLN